LIVHTLADDNYTGTVQVAANVATDTAGNSNTASNVETIYVDRKVPTITDVTSNMPDPTSGAVTLTINASDTGV
jgi:hypothetical protein